MIILPSILIKKYLSSSEYPPFKNHLSYLLRFSMLRAHIRPHTWGLRDQVHTLDRSRTNTIQALPFISVHKFSPRRVSMTFIELL